MDAWAAQGTAGRAKPVHPEGQHSYDSTDLSQGVLTVTRPSAELSAGASISWNSRIRPRVTPHWCFVYSSAMQVCHCSWCVDRVQTPVAMFRCQRGARHFPLNLPCWDLGPSRSHLQLQCCSMQLPGLSGGHRESAPTIWCSLSSFQRGGSRVLLRAASAVEQGRVTTVPAQLRDAKPEGMVWFCPHSH